ncbi:MAG: hypothetical protein M1823_003781 [Watsoniomyces obsoletus]|nr:MAG: hypothetical protein M1823_003781 [Watsoniomyces obsoletus]
MAQNATAQSPPTSLESGECELLGPFSLIVQSALGILALSSLVWKRYRERPRRPLKIWAFDASKQVVGSLLLHMANLLMSMLSAGKFSVKIPAVGTDGDQYQPNPCSFYLLNLGIDTTLGIPILVGLLRIFTYGFSLTPFGQPPESIQSGNYGRPPKTSWWAKQSLIYFFGLLGMKTCVLIIFNILPWISRVGDWALKWTEGNEALQVVFVMLLFPLIMNAIQYYIIDSFIKNSKPLDPDALDDSADDDDDRAGGHAGRTSDEYQRLSTSSDEGEEALTKGLVGGTARTQEPARRSGSRRPNMDSDVESPIKNSEDYDPGRDGERRNIS